jgi:excisionase family DNA binding protein
MNQAALAHSVAEACSIACVGRTALYEAIRSGALRAVKCGRRTLILHHDLLDWVESLSPVVVKSIKQPNDQESPNHG